MGFTQFKRYMLRLMDYLMKMARTQIMHVLDKKAYIPPNLTKLHNKPKTNITSEKILLVIIRYAVVYKNIC